MLKVWKDEKRIKIHKYGIGATEAKFNVTAEDLQDVSIFIMDASVCDTQARLNLKLRLKLLTLDGVARVYPALLAQKGSCYPNWVAFLWQDRPRAWQTCEIRQMLEETHTMNYGLAFGWERWLLKTEQSYDC